MCWSEEVTVKKSRKDRRCTYCADPIPAGSLYRRQRGIMEGEGFWTAALHPECARDIAERFDYCETYYFGQGERPPAGPVLRSFMKQ